MSPIRLVPFVALALVAPLAFAHSPAGTPKGYCEPFSEWNTHDYGPFANGQFLFIGIDGNQDDCNDDGASGDYDGHHEWASAGAFLLVEPSRSLACFNEKAHHPSFGPITVVDATFGPTVPFYVAADNVNLLGTDPCGDNLDDDWVLCVGACFAPFSPGLDGSYHVRVGQSNETAGTLGHVFSP